MGRVGYRDGWVAGHNAYSEDDVGRGQGDGGRRQMHGLFRKNSGTVRRRPWAENGGTVGGTRLISDEREGRRGKMGSCGMNADERDEYIWRCGDEERGCGCCQKCYHHRSHFWILLTKQVCHHY